MKRLWLLCLPLLALGCASTHIKDLKVLVAGEEVLSIASYTSARDLELTKTKDGWTVKAISSTPTKAMYDGLAPMLGAIAEGAAKGASPIK